MFAHVKFACDGLVANVPINFIKDFDETNFLGVTSHVFWSPNPADTPCTILNKEGKILMEPERKSSKSALPGYYAAKVLIVAETESKLVEEISSKEGRKVLCKVAENQGGCKNPALKKRKMSSVQIVKEGNKKTIKKLKEEVSKQTDIYSCLETDSDTDGSVIPSTIHRQEMANLKAELSEKSKKYLKLKEKYKSLQMKYDEVFQLNISLQKKLLSSPMIASGVAKSPDVPNSIIHSEQKRVEQQPSQQQSSHQPPSALDVTSDALQTSPSLSIDNAVENAILNISVEKLYPDLTYQVLSDENQPEDFSISEEKLKLVTFKVKPGIHGDSLFVKNLSMAVFGEFTLATSSVTGQKCRSKKEMGSAKPQLCPFKINYIKGLLIKRIQSENATKDDEEKRIKKLNVYIAEKIATLVRYKKE